MKNFIIIFSIFISLFSCGPKPEALTIEYKINNISTHNVKILVYHRHPNDVGTYSDTNIVFLLPQNEELKMMYINRHVDSPFGLLNDSAFVVFDNIKQIIYRRGDGQLRNILDINSYTGGKVNDYSYQYQYEITNEDYAVAIDIK